MSYRLNLAIINKEDRKTLSKMSISEYTDAYVSSDNILPIISELPTVEHIFLIGSLYDKDIFNDVELKPFFQDQDLTDYYSGEYELYLTNKKGLQGIINYYIKRTIEHYQGLVDEPTDFDKFRFPGENVKENKMHSFLVGRKHFWEYQQETITSIKDENVLAYAQEFEFEIFNLLYLIRKIDWETTDLIIYGW